MTSEFYCIDFRYYCTKELRSMHTQKKGYLIFVFSCLFFFFCNVASEQYGVASKKKKKEAQTPFHASTQPTPSIYIYRYMYIGMHQYGLTSFFAFSVVAERSYTMAALLHLDYTPREVEKTKDALELQ